MMVEDVPAPEPGPGEVLLKVRYCGICGSDVRLLPRGLVVLGAIPGHEVSAEVVALGPGVSGWQPGDLVATAGGGKCGQCEYCRAGRPHLCMQPKEGFGLGRRPGGYAQWLVADQEGLLRVPPHPDPAAPPPASGPGGDSAWAAVPAATPSGWWPIRRSSCASRRISIWPTPPSQSLSQWPCMPWNYQRSRPGRGCW